MSWHVSDTLVDAYTAGDLHGARAASVEAHVMACDRCRAAVGLGAPHDRLASVWSQVEELVDAPRTTWAERVLTGVGVSDSDARLIAAAPSLRLSWFTAMAAVLVFAVWAGQNGDRGAVVFLIIAPLVPVLAVAGAYGPQVDPMYEVSVSSPYPTLRLVLLRSAAVVLASGALAALASTLVPSLQVAVAWLLPSLALVSLTLVFARWLPMSVAAACVAASYALPLVAALYAGADALDVVLSAALQWTALAVGVTASIVMAADPQLRAALRRN